MFQGNISGNLSSPTYPETFLFERDTHALDTEEHGYCGRYTLTSLTENNKKHSAAYVTGDSEYQLRFLSYLKTCISSLLLQVLPVVARVELVQICLHWVQLQH